MTHYVGSWIGAWPPRGRTACGAVVFKTEWQGEADTEDCERVDYAEIWRLVTCRKCLRSTESKRRSIGRAALAGDMGK